MNKFAGLTTRQQQIASLVCHGLANKEIAEKLRVTEGTVKTHLHMIYQRLRIQCRSELAPFVLNAVARVGPIS
jgi:two-component system nitrate/nitrite response regulator NarL